MCTICHKNMKCNEIEKELFVSLHKYLSKLFDYLILPGFV